jgi:signal transduction histidine kinase/ActR/RegA family two-component response regulator
MVYLGALLCAALVASGVVQLYAVHLLGDAWTDYESHTALKQAQLASLHRALGYGGLVGEFKDYVLHDANPARIVRAHARIREATVALAGFEGAGVTAEESSKLALLDGVLVKYMGSLARAERMLKQGQSPSEVYRAVAIDDTPALDALAWLAEDINRLRTPRTRAVERAIASVSLVAAAATLPIAFALILLLTLGTAALRRAVTAPLRKLIDVMYRIVASHDDERVTQAPMLSQVRNLHDAVAVLERYAHLLEDARREAEQASLAKTAFVANVSHELRAPLGAIVGFSDLLLHEPLEGEALQQHLRQIDSAARTLEALVSDLLDLASIEEGRVDIASAPFALAGVIESVARRFAPAAEEAGISLEHTIDEQLPEVLVGDSQRLEQVVANLVGNAVKYTAAGSVSLRVTGDASDERHVALRIAVRDTGPGIAIEAQERIFERFEREAAPGPSDTPGSGLGLPIGLALAQRMGGDIHLVSRLGEGSCFTLQLRLAIAAPGDLDAAAPPATPQPAGVASQGSRVLLVDDNAMSVRVTVALLEKLGCEVTVARDGADGIAKWKDGAFSLLLMDCEMRSMDGFDATRRIRQAEEASDRPRTPIVALTGRVYAEDRKRCLAAGIDDYVSKPVRLADLRAIVIQHGGDDR